MTTSGRKPSRRQDWEALAERAMQTGDLMGARVAYTEILRQDRRNPQRHLEFAAALSGLGDIDEAVQHLTQAIRLKPQFGEAARRLSRLLHRFVIAEPGKLDPFGLKSALAFSGADAQPVAEVALRHLAVTMPDFAAALTETRAGRADEAAQKLVLNRTADVLKSDLMIAALHTGVVMDANVERLLTAVRRCLLLEVPAARFEDRALTAFALALVAQGWINDHAWAEVADETAALDAIVIDKAALASGDVENARRLMLRLLYRPLETIVYGTDADGCRGIRPKPVRDAVVAEMDRRVAERNAARAIPRLGTITDETSRRVAGQYETSPYPRWQSLHVSSPNAMKGMLYRFFEPQKLAFMDRPFDVLIAGAGTGRQALQSGAAYGPQAKLLATDLSAASLGYAATAAKTYDIGNVEFLVADILELDRVDRKFDIIECVGVLHHMADPWAGWRKLISRLKPGGLMYIGLYSGVSRSNIRALRDEPDYPGPGCDDAAARAYRARLLARPEGTPGSELKVSRDFYALNEFRDLLLHESEQHMTLEEIGRFLADNKLAFRGFTLEPAVMEAFSAQNPDVWPGTLQQWEAFERANPRSFDAMYRFWCERLPAA